MITTRQCMDGTWVDVSSPSQEEVDSLMLSYNIDPTVARDLLTPTPKQYLREGNDFVYIVIHIPAFDHYKNKTTEQEVDCVITERDLITTRYDSIDALH